MEMLIYSLLSTIGLLLYLPFILLKKGPECRQTYITERLGISSYKKTDIWVHAVSVGELLASLPFLKKLKREFPDKRIVLSTTTYTGQKIAHERFPEADRIIYMPVDSPVTITKAVKLLAPKIFIAVETELWPMLLYLLKKRGSHIITVNGRISDSSYKGYKKIRLFMKRILSHIDYLHMQTEKDAERIIELGAKRERVGIMGNFKFDIDLDQKGIPEWAINIKRPIFLAASTHRGEDEIILDAFFKIRDSKLQTLKLILVPRHPERFNEVEELINKTGLSYLRRSEIGQTTDTDKIEIILLDTMGELSNIYAISDIAFVGGSLVPVGGHNIMEPAFFSRPIIFGPHMNNFPVAKDFLNSSAAIEVNDAADIEKTVLMLLRDSNKAAEIGQSAKSIVDTNRGAVNRAIELVRGYIGSI